MSQQQQEGTREEVSNLDLVVADTASFPCFFYCASVRLKERGLRIED